MLRGVVMDIVAEPFKLGLVSNDVLPEPALPDAPFSAGPALRRNAMIVRLPTVAKQFDREVPLDPFPSGGEIRIAARKAPDAMNVVGQYDHRDCSEWRRNSNRPHHIAQKTDVGLAIEDSTAPVRDHREEIGLPG